MEALEGGASDDAAFYETKARDRSLLHGTQAAGHGDAPRPASNRGADPVMALEADQF